MDRCAHCGGEQTGCAGCGCCGGGEREVSLNRRQSRLLACFSQVPFLPLCGMEGDRGKVLPVFFPWPEADLLTTAQTLSELEALGLVTLDYDLPLAGYDYAEYESDPLPSPLAARGSMALTLLGQVVLEQLETL